MTTRTVAFYVEDFPRTLFPLETNKILVETAYKEIAERIHTPRVKGAKPPAIFLPQTRAWATKAGLHLRRTCKLDPVAEYFLYDLIYRHRGAFRGQRTIHRVNFGYRFTKKKWTSPATGYRAFRNAIVTGKEKYKYCAKFDVSSYFNSIYHHDLVKWFLETTGSDSDAELFDKFLKQTNSGRSVDCLPQGVYPAKVIGSWFLSSVDASTRLASPLLLRFMDDFYLFSDKRNDVISDFLIVQEELGRRGLSVNPSKTTVGPFEDEDIEGSVDTIKGSLLAKRRQVITASSAEYSDEENESDDDEQEDGTLSEEQIEYLVELLRSGDIEEEDAELVLALMRDHSEDVLERLPAFLQRFPNLSKSLYHFAASVEDTESLADIVLKHVRSDQVLPEFQLFWIGWMVEARLLGTRSASEIVGALMEHSNATALTKAKILEIADSRYGLPELREEELRRGESGWVSWAAAAGTRHLRKAGRNHLLDYVANASPMNELIASAIRKL